MVCAHHLKGLTMHKKNVNTEFNEINALSAKNLQGVAKFKPFNWLASEAQTPERDLLGMALDVSRGVALSLQIIERNQLEERYGTAVLSATDCGILERFSISACQLMANAIEERFTFLNDSVSNGGAK